MPRHTNSCPTQPSANSWRNGIAGMPLSRHQFAADVVASAFDNQLALRVGSPRADALVDAPASLHVVTPGARSA